MALPTSRYESTPLSPEMEAQPHQSRSHESRFTDGDRVKDEVGTPLLFVSEDFDSMSLDAKAPHNVHMNRFENPPLTTSPSPDRLSRPPTLQAQAHRSPAPTPTLFPNFRNLPNNNGRSYGFPSLNPSFSNDLQLGNISRYGHSPQASSLSSTPSHHDSINHLSPRPRTSSHPVFHTASDLAAHHGIPQSLPPVPRITRYSEPSASTSSSSPPNNEFDFNHLMSNYLTMLSQKPEEPSSTVASAPVTHAPVSDAAAAQALLEIIQASPEFQMANDFMTSPMDDSSPWEDILTTPALGSDDIASEFLTSPAIVDTDDFGDFGGLPLFGDGLILSGAPQIKAPSSTPIISMPAFNFDGMYTMPSPNTPALDPSSLHPSPQINADSLPPSKPASRRKSAPTGTRKNVTPESLVPFDAPIQTRKYVTPSATSRKEVPAVFARKRARSQAFGDADEDQLEEDLSGLPPSMNELDAIEAKRRQNTLAARRSRKRKLEYQRELEEGLEHEREEKEMWRARSQLLEALLISHGHEVPPLSR